MDPLVSKWYKAKFLKICSDEERLIFGWTIPLTNTLNINKDILSCLQSFLGFLVLLDQNKRIKFDRKHEAFSESISLQKSCYICRSGVNAQAHRLTKWLRHGLANVTSANSMLLWEIRLWFLFNKAFVCLLQMYAIPVQGHLSNKVERCKRVTSILHFSLIDGRHRGEIALATRDNFHSSASVRRTSNGCLETGRAERSSPWSWTLCWLRESGAFSLFGS